MSKKIIPSFILATLFLASCASSPESCDPKIDPGFFSKFGCIASGSYAERTAQKKEDISNLRTELEALSEETVALNDKDALVNETRAQSQRRLDRLQEKIATLQEQNARRNSSNSAITQDLNSIQEQISKMKSMPENASILEKRNEKARLEQELDDLLQSQAVVAN